MRFSYFSCEICARSTRELAGLLGKISMPKRLLLRYIINKTMNCFYVGTTDSNPMSARNFPASFWNSNYVPPTPTPAHHQMSDLYSAESSLYSTEPWVHNAAHYGSYAAAHAHGKKKTRPIDTINSFKLMTTTTSTCFFFSFFPAYHHNMAQYGSLLRLPQQYSHSSR